jgi:hypothetical protein
VNFYRYVSNAPVNEIDPSGLQTFTETVVATAEEVAAYLARLEAALAKEALDAAASAKKLPIPRIPVPIVLVLEQRTAGPCEDYIYPPPGCPNYRPQPESSQKQKPLTHGRAGCKWDDEDCDEMYSLDMSVCRSLPLRERAACYAQAKERLTACELGKPIPPFPWRRPN